MSTCNPQHHEKRFRLCLYHDCFNTRRTRGLCHLHYQAARSYIRGGRTTEASLMERGLLTPKGAGGSHVPHHHLLLDKNE